MKETSLPLKSREKETTRWKISSYRVILITVTNIIGNFKFIGNGHFVQRRATKIRSCLHLNGPSSIIARINSQLEREVTARKGSGKSSSGESSDL